MSFPRNRRLEGMTLLEVMIVVTMLALATSVTTLAVGALTRTQLRSACMRVAAAAKFAYNRAIAEGKTLRVAIDTDSHQLSIEEARGQVFLADAEDPRGQEGEGDDEAAVDPWEAARTRLKDTFEPSFGRSPFQPLSGPDGDPLERYRNVELGDGIRVVRLYLPHEIDPRETGQGAVYFFPTGMTEHAVIQLSDGGEESIYSVEIHPLTGRARVHDFAYDPQELDEDDFVEVEDR
ncbi:MAG: pilus assembly FimT family protein [Myxococcota bacterium]